MQIGGREFDFHNRTYIMGILNVTPDSFSDGGRYRKLDAALSQAEEMLREGADVIDVGGESTRPGYTRIPDAEEAGRVVPVIEALKERFDAPISVDTYKGSVAREALAAGAVMINDIWGFQADREMAGIAAASGAACCLMHNRADTAYSDFIGDVKSGLRESVRLAQEAGVAPEKILLDPGIGFAKDTPQNLELLRRLREFGELGFPILLGASRKSVIGNTLGLPVGQRVEGTLVTTVMAVEAGCAFVRVHDVKENFRAIQMAEAILYG